MNTSLPPTARPTTRQGTIIIVVAGISALLAAMALTFVVNAQADARESELVIQDGQARIMLASACAYILEASRIGWEPMQATDPTGTTARKPVSLEHVEAFGWIDVRNGSLGPQVNTLPISDTERTDHNNEDANGNRYRVQDLNGNLYPVDKAPVPNPFPVGASRRFPMHVLTRPPFAISPRVAENPINPAVAVTRHLRNADPQPAVNNYNEWAKGDVLLGTDVNGFPIYKFRQDSYGKSWFRLYREKSGASFIVTCGAGGTLGYRTWKEVEDEEAAALSQGKYADMSYFGSRDMFETLRQSEYRMWYRVEWNAAVVVQEMNYFREGAEHSGLLSGFSHAGGGHNRSDSPHDSNLRTLPRYGNNYSAQWQASNMCGSIQYIQRLLQEPPVW